MTLITLRPPMSNQWRRRDMMLRVLGVRLLSRLLVLVCSLSLLSLLFLSRCGFNNLESDLIDTAGDRKGREKKHASFPDVVSGPVTTTSLAEANQREEETRLEVERLTAEIRTLKLQILQLTGGPPGHSEAASMLNATDVGDCLAARRQVDLAEISQGLPHNNEYELIAFSHFTFSRVYPVDLGLGKRVVEKPIGFKRKDLLEALAKAVDTLNRNTTQSTTKKYTVEDFLEGLYRVEPTTGTQYEMYFRTKNLNKSTQITGNGYTKVTLMRPYTPIQFVGIEKQLPAKEKELIHIILPLSGRTSTFQSFMDKFVKIGLKNDKRVHLTVVYFGTEGLSEARAIMSRVLMTRGSGGSNQNLRLLALNETFSRGKGLRVGAERAWGGEADVLLFMCDVDVVFSARFLDSFQLVQSSRGLHSSRARSTSRNGSTGHFEGYRILERLWIRDDLPVQIRLFTGSGLRRRHRWLGRRRRHSLPKIRQKQHQGHSGNRSRNFSHLASEGMFGRTWAAFIDRPIPRLYTIQSFERSFARTTRLPGVSRGHR
ncbi:chondroitin sulfate N-acetylgalactosaminyltransferase 1 isoform X4 [Athalia rosae]|uniref:chondroitin sulfate N-acetylgalactosaminyltransferase 1 isoform X4 n=1 Tax=Athalia rosae TaxID=37344 RepID=UPI002034156B|nr:chondroitin sulfate N-acetylgalactosaminyltransferase 1 isoform X4 [Athalia rosae]